MPFRSPMDEHMGIHAKGGGTVGGGAGDADDGIQFRDQSSGIIEII